MKLFVYTEIYTGPESFLEVRTELFRTSTEAEAFMEAKINCIFDECPDDGWEQDWHSSDSAHLIDSAGFEYEMVITERSI